MNRELNNLLFQYFSGLSNSVYLKKDISNSSYIEKDICLFIENKIVPANSLFLYDNFIEGVSSPEKSIYYSYKMNKSYINDHQFEKSYNNFFTDMKKQRLSFSFMRSKSGNNVVNLFNAQGSLWDLDTNELLVSLCIPNHFFIAFCSLKSSEEKLDFVDKNLENNLTLYIDRKFLTDDKYNTWRKKFDTYYLHFVRMFNIDIIETTNLGSKIFKTVKLLPEMNSLEKVEKYFSYIEDKLVEDIFSTL
jgi:hypothetical protein|nr:MAG TPA: hypothetical protein [Caudoviricetes sp.]